MTREKEKRGGAEGGTVRGFWLYPRVWDREERECMDGGLRSCMHLIEAQAHSRWFTFLVAYCLLSAGRRPRARKYA